MLRPTDATGPSIWYHAVSPVRTAGTPWTGLNSLAGRSVSAELGPIRVAVVGLSIPATAAIAGALQISMDGFWVPHLQSDYVRYAKQSQ